jgi:hypothetical protein
MRSNGFASNHGRECRFERAERALPDGIGGATSSFNRFGLGYLGLFRRGRRGEQFTRLRYVGDPVGTGEQAIVTDAVEAFWQHMQQEPSDELVRVQRHSLISSWPLDPVILLLEGDAGRGGRDQAAIGMATRWV